MDEPGISDIGRFWKSWTRVPVVLSSPADTIKFSHLQDIDVSYRLLADAAHITVRPAVISFIANMERVKHLAILPPLLIDLSMILESRWATACFNVLGKPSLEAGDFHRDREVRTELTRLYTQPLTDAENAQLRLLGTENLVALSTVNSLPVGIGLRTLIDSLLVLALTACETLLSDLWLVAVNNGKKGLAEKIFDAQLKCKGGLKPESLTTRGQEKTIPISCLKDYGYDLRSHMGNLLVDQEKVDFQSLWNAAKAYIVVFGSVAENLFDARNSDFSDLLLLSALRNILVHKGGKIDKTFREDLGKSKNPSINYVLDETIPDGTPLYTNGGVAVLLINSSVRFAGKLIDIVSASLVE